MTIQIFLANWLVQEVVVKLRKDWIQELYIMEFLKPKLQPEDFYWVDGKMIMTEHYHLRRGTCCGSGCRHCPYEKNKQTEPGAKKSAAGNN